MAVTATTLASAKATNDKVIKLTSATGVANKMRVLVDGEMMRVTDVSRTPTIEVVPGYDGTTAGPHGVLAPAIYGIPADFGQVGGPQTLSFGVDGAITGPGGTGTVPVVDTVIYLTKATAGAYTLAGPAAWQQNTLIFVSTTAAAHTLTYTAGFYGNTTGSDVATFPATINGTFTIKAQNGTWAPIATADDGVLIG